MLFDVLSICGLIILFSKDITSEDNAIIAMLADIAAKEKNAHVAKIGRAHV